MADRRRLPSERKSLTHKFDLAGTEGYVTVGLYEDGTPGEVFVKLAKEGSTLAGLVDGWALEFSMLLQYGVPLEALVEKFRGTRFEPCGYTQMPGIGFATSLYDYIVRWLALRFLSDAVRASLPPGDGPPCAKCGTGQFPVGESWSCPKCNGGRDDTR